MNLFKLLFSMIPFFSNKHKSGEEYCVTFTIGEDTGCQYMCDYCAENLGTNDFYFTDWICKNKNGMCSGDPTSWETYTCCTK